MALIATNWESCLLSPVFMLISKDFFLIPFSFFRAVWHVAEVSNKFRVYWSFWLHKFNQTWRVFQKTARLKENWCDLHDTKHPHLQTNKYQKKICPLDHSTSDLAKILWPLSMQTTIIPNLGKHSILWGMQSLETDI